jgi:hypothetical protein
VENSKKMKIVIFFLVLFSSMISHANGDIDECAALIDNSIQSGVQGVDVESNISKIKESFDLEKTLDCVGKTMPSTLPIKTLYAVFGDVLEEAMGYVLSFLDVDVSISDEFKEMKKFMSGNTMEVIFTSMTTIVFALTSMILLFQSGGILISSAQSGEFMGKQINTSWTIAKLGIGMSLLMPIGGLGGYSLAQLLVIMAAVFGTIVANIAWILLVSVINVILFTSPDSVINDNQSLGVESSEKVAASLVELEICNLERNLIYLEKDAASGRVTADIYKDNEFQQCLTKDISVIRRPVDPNSGIVMYTPDHHVATDKCVKEVYKKETEACGSIQHVEFAEISESTIIKKSRSIAAKVMNMVCMNKDILDLYGRPYQYGYVCAEFDDDGEFIFENNSLKYVDKDADAVAYKLEIHNDITELMSSMQEYSRSVVLSSLKEYDSSSQTRGLIKKGLINGWFGASHFLIDSSNNYRELNRIANIAWDNTVIESNARTNNALVFNNQLEEGNILKLYHISLRSNWEDVKDDSSTALSMVLVKKLFGGFFTLNNFLGIKQYGSYAEEVGKEDNCFKNFSNCSKVTINPLYDYLKMGNDILNNSAYIVMAMTAIEVGVQGYKSLKGKDPDKGLFSGVLQSLLLIIGVFTVLIKIYFIIGILIVYVTPMIPFLYFFSYIISWILLVIEGVVTAQLWAFLHMIPSKEEGFSENVKDGYNVIFTIFLQPIILIMAMVLSLAATSTAIGIFNILFGIIMSTFSISENPTGLLEFAFNIVIYLIYAIFLTLIIIRVTKIIFEVPDSLTRTLQLTQMPGGGAQGWTEVLQKVQVIVNTNVLGAFKL